MTNRQIFISTLQAFARDDDGSVAIEYGVIAVALCLAISPAFYMVSGAVTDKFAGIGGFFTQILQ